MSDCIKENSSLFSGFTWSPFPKLDVNPFATPKLADFPPQKEYSPPQEQEIPLGHQGFLQPPVGDKEKTPKKPEKEHSFLTLSKHTCSQVKPFVSFSRDSLPN